MVNLVRTVAIVGQPEEAFALAAEITKYLRGFEGVQDAQLVMNINGPQNQLHFVVTLDSLADEERFARKAYEDERYMELMRRMAGKLSWPTDNLSRTIPLD